MLCLSGGGARLKWGRTMAFPKYPYDMHTDKMKYNAYAKGFCHGQIGRDRPTGSGLALIYKRKVLQEAYLMGFDLWIARAIELTEG